MTVGLVDCRRSRRMVPSDKVVALWGLCPPSVAIRYRVVHRGPFFSKGPPEDARESARRGSCDRRRPDSPSCSCWFHVRCLGFKTTAELWGPNRPPVVVLFIVLNNEQYRRDPSPAICTVATPDRRTPLAIECSPKPGGRIFSQGAGGPR